MVSTFGQYFVSTMILVRDLCAFWFQPRLRSFYRAELQDTVKDAPKFQHFTSPFFLMLLTQGGAEKQIRSVSEM